MPPDAPLAAHAQQVRAEQDDRRALEDDRQGNRKPVAVLVEPEQRAGLADFQSDDRAGGECDTADSGQGGSPAAEPFDGCEQGQAECQSAREVRHEQRADYRDHPVIGAEVLLEVQYAGGDEQQRAEVPRRSQ